MKKDREDEQPGREDRSTPSQFVWSRAPLRSGKYSRATLVLSCSREVPSRLHQRKVSLFFHVIGAFDGDRAVGFAAFKATTGAIRVSHELWGGSARAVWCGVSRGGHSRGARVGRQSNRMFATLCASRGPFGKHSKTRAMSQASPTPILVWFEKGLSLDLTRLSLPNVGRARTSERPWENGDRMSRTKQLCRLEKGGSQIAFLLTDMES